MSALMAEPAKRLRVSFDADDEVMRRAIYIAAAMKGVSHNELINTLIRLHLPDAVALAKKAVEGGDDPPPRRKASAG